MAFVVDAAVAPSSGTAWNYNEKPVSIGANEDGSGGFRGFGGAAFEDLCNRFVSQYVRKSCDVQASNWTAANCVHITDGVGDCDSTVVIRVVDDRRKEIERLDHRQVVGEPIYGGVVRRRDPYKQVRMGDRRQLAQDLSQVVWTKFGGSTGATG